MRISTGLALFIGLTSVACGGKTPLPKGPPPEYEEEPAPSASEPQAVAPPSPSPAGPADGGAGG